MNSREIKRICISLFIIAVLTHQLAINIGYSNLKSSKLVYQVKSLCKEITKSKYIWPAILGGMGLNTPWKAFTKPPTSDFRYDVVIIKNDREEELFSTFPRQETYNILISHLIYFRNSKFTHNLFRKRTHKRLYARYLCKENGHAHAIAYQSYVRKILDSSTAAHYDRLSYPYATEFKKTQREVYQCNHS